MTSPIDNLRAFKESYTSDLMMAISLMMKDDTQYNRRNVVRIQFSLIDGYTYLSKQEILNYSISNPDSFTTAEIAILKEEAYELNSKGSVVIREKYYPTAGNFIFVYKLYTKLNNPEFEIDLSSHLWESFKKSLKIRNRVTHPKILSDLDISDEDIKIVHEAGKWFRHISMEAMKSAN